MTTPPDLRWYVVFCQTAQRRWWDYVFRTGRWSHVFALRWDGFNVLMFEPGAEYTEVAVLDAVEEHHLWDYVPEGAEVYHVLAKRRPGVVRGRWWVGPMTCVEQVKALLGIPVGWIWTPGQLRRFLRGLEAEDAAEVRLPGRD